MISLLRGPGGPFLRLAQDLIPFLVGLHAWAWLWPLVGLVPALALGLGLWVGVSALARGARARPGWRRAWRVTWAVLMAWLVAQGAGQSRPQATAPSTGAGLRRAADAGPLRAGCASRAFSLPPATPLAGWGQWPRRQRLPAWFGLGPVGRASLRATRPAGPGQASHPLFHAAEPGREVGVRALVLRTDAGPPFVLVRLDVVVADSQLTQRLLQALGDLGVRPETLVVAATHTHSGPGGYVDRPLAEVVGTGWFDARILDALVQAAEGAVRAAYAAAAPARLAVVDVLAADAQGRALLGRNRRQEGPDRVEARVQGLRLDDESGRPIAAVLAAAVHPVLFRPSHRALDPDLAGALEVALSQQLDGAPVLFLNGAVADVTPVRGGLAPAARALELAREFAAVAGPAFRSAPGHERVRLQAARRMLWPGSAHGVIGVGERGALSQAMTSPPWEPPDLLGWLGLPLSAAAWAAGFPEARVLVSARGLGLGVNLQELSAQDGYAVGVWRLDAGAGSEPLGALLWHPGEPTQALGRTWRKEFAAAGAPLLLHVALANGAAGYLTTPSEYDAGGYEASATLYGPGAAARFEQALLGAWAELR